MIKAVWKSLRSFFLKDHTNLYIDMIEDEEGVDPITIKFKSWITVFGRDFSHIQVIRDYKDKGVKVGDFEDEIISRHYVKVRKSCTTQPTLLPNL